MAEAKKYRKRPVVIEAIQWDGTDGSARTIQDWANTPGAVRVLYNVATLVIQTLEGDMTATPGDWIIRGVKGEFYPCKPDIFQATYEEAPE